VRIATKVWLYVATLSLAACASPTLVKPGPFQVGTTQVQVGREWSDISVIMPDGTKKVRLLSVDGPLLNRLYITDTLSPGDIFLRPRAREKPTPVFREGMSPSERMEFVTDNVSAMGFQRVERRNPKPARYLGQPAIRFEIAAQTAEGLDVSGLSVVTSTGDRIRIVLYLAPSEHYFAKYLPDVEAVIQSPGAAG